MVEKSTTTSTIVVTLNKQVLFDVFQPHLERSLIESATSKDGTTMINDDQCLSIDSNRDDQSLASDTSSIVEYKFPPTAPQNQTTAPSSQITTPS